MDLLDLKPFRWSIEKRNEIGSLIDYVVVELPEDFKKELIKSSARILAFSGNSMLYFVGRSPENYFDFLSGIFDESKDRKNKINLFQFSGRDYTYKKLANEYSLELNYLRKYMLGIGLSPNQILRRKIATSLIDVVHEGYTFKILIEILYHWALEEKVNWKELKKKLQIVGITVRTKNSPNTWRWQQQVEWIELIGKSNVKNVSVPWSFWGYIANDQSKATDSNYPKRWSDPEIEKPMRSKYNREGLKIAVTLFDLGLKSETKEELKKSMVEQSEMQYSWFRAYLQWLK